jgi:hypothetical protein
MRASAAPRASMMHLSAWTRNHAAFGCSSIEDGFRTLTQFVDPLADRTAYSR